MSENSSLINLANAICENGLERDEYGNLQVRQNKELAMSNNQDFINFVTDIYGYDREQARNKTKGNKTMSNAVEELEARFDIKRAHISNKSFDWSKPGLSCIPDIPEFSLTTQVIKDNKTAPNEDTGEQEYVDNDDEPEITVKKEFSFNEIYGKSPDYQKVLTSLIDKLGVLLKSDDHGIRNDAKTAHDWLTARDRVSKRDIRTLAEAIWLLEGGRG